MRRICNLLIVALMLSLAVAVIGCAPKLANFELSSLDVSPEVCQCGDTVVASATLANIGNAKGDYMAELLVNGAVEQTQTFTVEPGTSQSVSFTLAKDEPGSYVVQLEELTASFTVEKPIKPAEFKVSGLEITPNPVKVGDQATITVTIKNVGEAEGTYSATLLVDGTVYETTDVTLAGGATELVSVVASKDSPDSYSIEIGGLDAILEVIQPVRLETGTYLVQNLPFGKAHLDIRNEVDVDAVVVLSKVTKPEIARLAFYLQSYDSYEYRRIPHGSYVIYIALGEGWDEDSRRFLTRATYYRFKEEFPFKSNGTRTTWTITLAPPIISTYAQLIGEDEFPKLE